VQRAYAPSGVAGDVEHPVNDPVQSVVYVTPPTQLESVLPLHESGVAPHGVLAAVLKHARETSHCAPGAFGSQELPPVRRRQLTFSSTPDGQPIATPLVHVTVSDGVHATPFSALHAANDATVVQLCAPYALQSTPTLIPASSQSWSAVPTHPGAHALPSNDSPPQNALALPAGTQV
jgi:hypothetical protein